MSKILVEDSLIRSAMLVSARRFEVPISTRLRVVLEQLTDELDIWAVTSSEARLRRTSRVRLRKIGVSR
jgi:hypothetical protein